MKRILVAYDGSVEARDALDRARELAGADDSVTVVNVMPEPAVGSGIAPPAEERNKQWRLLEEARRSIATHGLDVETIASCGDAAAEIVAAAEAIGADVIVVAPHRKMRHHLLGSVTGHVVRAAKCDVLVVRVANTERQRSQCDG